MRLVVSHALWCWTHLDDFGASEFGGGRLTASLIKMADFASVLFAMALLLTFFRPRFAAAVVLPATLLCLPLYLYLLMPGLYRWILKGEYSVTIDRPFHWNNWAAVGILSLLFVVVLSFRTYSKDEIKSLGHKE